MPCFWAFALPEGGVPPFLFPILQRHDYQQNRAFQCLQFQKLMEEHEITTSQLALGSWFVFRIQLAGPFPIMVFGKISKFVCLQVYTVDRFHRISMPLASHSYFFGTKHNCARSMKTPTHGTLMAFPAMRVRLAELTPSVTRQGEWEDRAWTLEVGICIDAINSFGCMHRCASWMEW